MLFKDAVSLPPRSSFRILSHQISHDNTLNGSNSTGRQGTSKHTFKRFLVTLSIAKNNKNTITVVKTVNVLMKVIHDSEVNTNKVKIELWKSKQTNL